MQLTNIKGKWRYEEKGEKNNIYTTGIKGISKFFVLIKSSYIYDKREM